MMMKTKTKEPATKKHDKYYNNNINKYNYKSLYLNYLLSAQNHVKMSSLTDQYIKNKERNDNLNKNHHQEEFATFTIQIPSTTLTIQRKLACLTNIQHQDLFKWKTNFLETKLVCNWDENTAITVLENITSTDYLHLLKKHQTLSEKISAIFDLKYPSNTSYSIAQELSGLRQTNFYTIEDYIKKIDELTNKLAVMRHYTMNQINEKREETFYQGLDDLTKLEMTRLNIITYKEMYQVITETEKLLIQQYSYKQRYDYNEDTTNKGYKKNYEKYVKKKWCKIHRSRSHNTEECRKQSTNTENEKKRSYAIMEPNVKPKNIELNLKIKEKVYEALIDTGSVYNYITEKVVNENSIKKCTMNEIAQAELANGQLIKINEKCELKFHIGENTHHQYIDTFRILPGTKAQIILGMEFLQKNETIINLKENTIIIDGKEIEIWENQCDKNATDNYINEKTRICTINDTDNETHIKIKNLIKQHKLTNPKLGNIKIDKHQIILTGNEYGTNQRYTIPNKIEKQSKELLQELIQKKVIRKSNAMQVSPAFIIHKKNNKLRLVVDYRKLNKITKPLNYPIPKMSNLLNDLYGSQIFSQIDLNMGYYQIQVFEEDIYKTAFSLGNETYEFLRMPFGLTNAPRTFQKTMNRILEDLDFVKIYLDDILIHSKNIYEHLDHLNTVLRKLQEANASINFEKSKFGEKEVTYLGNIINKDGIRPDTSRIKTFNNFIPKNKKHLQQLLGFYNWFRPFVRNMSTLTRNLTNKLQTIKEFYWTNEDDIDNKKIMKEIEKQTLIKYPNYEEEFILEVDANEFACGGMLYQKDGVIGFFSNKFNNTEINYTIIEKETLAILKSLNHFKQTIFGYKIKIYTDNTNIINPSSLTKRINRWKLILEEYQYTLHHIKGKSNTGADGLTRLHCIQTNEVDNRIIIDWKEIAEAQKADKKIEEITHEKELINKEEIAIDKKRRIIIPDHIATEFVKDLHIKLIHPGKNKMLYTIIPYFNINKINKLISNISKICNECKINKKTTKKYGKIKGNISADNPCETLSSDILGPLKTKHFNTKTSFTYFYILTLTDIYTRYTKISIIFDITSNTICQNINKMIQEFLPVKKMITDQGRQYMSSNFKLLLKNHNIKHCPTTPYNPTGNSISERLNQQILETLRLGRNKTFTEIRKDIEIRLNYTYHSCIKLNPYEFMHNKSAFQGLTKLPNIDKRIIQQNESQNKTKNERNTNKKRIKHVYRINDMVYKKNVTPDKLERRWNGPYKILNIHDENTVEIEENNKTSIQNIKNLLPAEGGGECREATISNL